MAEENQVRVSLDDPSVNRSPYSILRPSHGRWNCRSLATFFNFEISGLADRSLMEIEENVNPGTQKGGFSEIPLGNRKNMQSQIVVCDNRKRESPYSASRCIFWHAICAVDSLHTHGDYWPNARIIGSGPPGTLSGSCSC